MSEMRWFHCRNCVENASAPSCVFKLVGQGDVVDAYCWGCGKPLAQLGLIDPAGQADWLFPGGLPQEEQLDPIGKPARKEGPQCP